MSAHGPVVIMQLPEALDSLGTQTFMQELEPLLDSQRPRIVFDCSEVRYMDGPGIEMMLHCLEATRKRDGDLKLATLSPEAQLVLELMRDAPALEAFASSDDAVRSFNALSAARPSQKAPLNAKDFDLRGLRRAS
jgi:anti-sigma B factor antagonist